MPEQPKKFETPVNKEAELAVIGSIMIEGNSGIRRVNHLIKAEDFFYRQYQLVYATYERLLEDGIEIDVITVSDSLKSAGTLEEAGGYEFLSEVTSYVPSTHRLVSYAKIVAKYSSLRRILDAARDIGRMTQNNDGDLDKLLLQAEARFKGVTRESARQQNRLELVDLQDYMTKARENREPEGTIRGLSTGLKKLDAMTQGFVPGELMIISGQTSHGKTQLTNNIILNAVRNDHKVMFVTMEMTKQETADRFNSLTNNQDIGEGKIFLNMRSDLAYTDVTKLIERAKEKGCDMVAIDHLHYFSRSVENATHEVSKIVKEFKSAAVQYELPVILICHVRKMPASKHPGLEDLRDSSLIAQDADLVLMVWRDEKHGATNPFQVEVQLLKNRNRQRKHRRDFLYADGLKLVEEDPGVKDRQSKEYYDNTARMLGEKDDDLDLNDLEGFSAEDLSIPGF